MTHFYLLLRGLLPVVCAVGVASACGIARTTQGPPSRATCWVPPGTLFIAIGEMELKPGAVDTLRVVAFTGPGSPEPLFGECGTTWSVSPRAPATIDAAGVLRVRADAPDAVTFVVRAHGVGHDVTAAARIVDRALNPIFGRWVQVMELACDAAATEEAPAERIGELRFFANGRFNVTWMPFESYVDYAGTFSYDRATGALRLAAERVNYLPVDLDVEGYATVRGDTLILREMWLGRQRDASPKGCGHRFRR